MVPETNYARSGDIQVAYQVVGEGSVDIVLVPGFVSNIEVFWEEPRCARFLRRIGSFARLIMFDKRGTGLSDRVDHMPILEERMDDVRAVMDAVGSKKAFLFGYSEGAPLCALFAATYPDRTNGLILNGGYAREVKTSDYPYGVTAEEMETRINGIENNWSKVNDLETKAPSVAKDEMFWRWRSRFLRMSASPSAAVALRRANAEIDIRHVLPSINVPTLILHALRDREEEIGHGRYLAAHIPGAELIELDSDDHLPWLTSADAILEKIELFVTGQKAGAEVDRILATIMFTDIVDSTKLAVTHGDQKWADLLSAHRRLVRHEVDIFGGREVDTNGDGFVFAFDGPARAIRCAQAVVEAIKGLGLQLRAGLHTGECEIADGEMRGLALHVAARVSSRAGPDDVLVSRTVKDLVAGSGIDFDDLGSFELKGVPDQWQLYKVQ